VNLVIVCLLSGLRKVAAEKVLKLYVSKEYSVAEITELTGASKATLCWRLKESSA
jgi:predicted DNA-binding protein YlxM (UPF0122 family)